MPYPNRKVGAVATKQRLYSSPEMATVFREWCDHERFLYNLSVEQFEFAARYRGCAAHPNEAVKSRQHWPSPAERARQLAELRAELDWLRSGPSAVQQQALRVVDRAYANWFKNPAHFRRPSFRDVRTTAALALLALATTSISKRSTVAGRKFGSPKSVG
jgi:putative transposase